MEPHQLCRLKIFFIPPSGSCRKSHMRVSADMFTSMFRTTQLLSYTDYHAIYKEGWIFKKGFFAVFG